MFKRWMVSCWCVCASTLMSTYVFGAVVEESLSLGSKHWSPTIFSKSGFGTANAVAEARLTRSALEGWCANWSPEDKRCVAQTLAAEAKQTYRASADCLAGRITNVDGKPYTFAGTWDNSDIGGGRTRWRDAGGKIVGRDNASGGLGISANWEVLCPGPLKFSRTQNVAAAARATQPVQPTQPSQPAVTAAFAVGEAVEARYGREWISGRVNSIRQSKGAQGPELVYEVLLENGKRGMLPARMVRRPGG